MKSYLIDAFGTTEMLQAINDRIHDGEGIVRVDGQGNWQLGLSDGAFIVEMNSPDTPVEIQNGKITFTGCIECMDMWLPEPALLSITLDVIQTPDSRYGCQVLGYSVTAADASMIG